MAEYKENEHLTTNDSENHVMSAETTQNNENHLGLSNDELKHLTKDTYFLSLAFKHFSDKDLKECLKEYINIPRSTLLSNPNIDMSNNIAYIRQCINNDLDIDRPKLLRHLLINDGSDPTLSNLMLWRHCVGRNNVNMNIPVGDNQKTSCMYSMRVFWALLFLCVEMILSLLMHYDVWEGTIFLGIGFTIISAAVASYGYYQISKIEKIERVEKTGQWKCKILCCLSKNKDGDDHTCRDVFKACLGIPSLYTHPYGEL